MYSTHYETISWKPLSNTNRFALVHPACEATPPPPPPPPRKNKKQKQKQKQKKTPNKPERESIFDLDNDVDNEIINSMLSGEIELIVTHMPYLQWAKHL